MIRYLWVFWIGCALLITACNEQSESLPSPTAISDSEPALPTPTAPPSATTVPVEPEPTLSESTVTEVPAEPSTSPVTEVPAEPSTSPVTEVPTEVPTPLPSPTVKAQPTRASHWGSIFGVEVNRNNGERVALQAQEAQVNWLRYNGILWHEVESTQGVHDWSQLNKIEKDLQALAEAGTTSILIVRGTPDWAQKVPGALCGPIHEEALDDFALFMSELVKRYSQSPYNIKYWELGNEPDVDPALINVTWPFGCWGDQSDPYYGGGYYAEALKRIYPAIKEADPEAQLLIGGLLLDCDPTNPPEGKDCLPSRFLEGILQNGGGDAFDMVAYHAYPLWSPDVPDEDAAHPAWQSRGGALVGKLDFIREVMAQYGVDKPVIMDEGGLVCHESNTLCPSEAFHQDQASHLVRMMTRSWANGLVGAAWYTLNGPGWRQGGLLDADQQPRPAYFTLLFLSSLLDGATFTADLSDGTVEGYQFNTTDLRYDIYWTQGEVVPFTIPEGTLTVYDKLGSELPVGAELELSIEPVILERVP